MIINSYSDYFELDEEDMLFIQDENYKTPSYYQQWQVDLVKKAAYNLIADFNLTAS